MSETDSEQVEAEAPHEHDIGTVLQKFDGALWKVNRRMVNVDSDVALYELHEINDASVTEIATAEDVAEWYDEPELVTDGGKKVEAELHHCEECGDDVPATWDGGVLTCDECSWVIYK